MCCTGLGGFERRRLPVICSVHIIAQVGTLNYMSPEAILGGATNIRGAPPMKVPIDYTRPVVLLAAVKCAPSCKILEQKQSSSCVNVVAGATIILH